MKIPKIALGTGGVMKGNNNLIDMLESVKEFGCNHIDTAHGYRNEIQVGDDIKKLGWNKVFITSKIEPFNMKYHTKKVFLESKKALGHIDLILLHGPVSREVNALAFNELIKLRDEGLVKYIGVSNFEIEQIQELFEDTSEYPVNNQIRITPTYCDQELIDYCQSKDIQVSAYSPLGSYYRKDSNFYMNDEQLSYIDSLASKYKKTPSNIIFRWLIDKKINIVFQSRKPERVKSNFDVDHFKLETEEIERINSFDRGERIIEMSTPTEEQSRKGSFIFE